MEIDRIKANHEYLKDNVVLACYWCNNAKSDEFSEPEFTRYRSRNWKSMGIKKEFLNNFLKI